MLSKRAAVTTLLNFSQKLRTENSRNLWKRPHVRIPLVVDLLVCALLQSGQYNNECCHEMWKRPLVRIPLVVDQSVWFLFSLSQWFLKCELPPTSRS
ncbi:hypothetical protein T07_4950 [Trichinella nelsoni]|uniref:Uncharacterized protein n=1 Tax=Trichinella nelsoni TaxID=6336 RepID=A0A0V0REI2_9BILA|nr:hypothetical protein T07_4950 [Trichinella nelsoni]